MKFLLLLILSCISVFADGVQRTDTIVSDSIKTEIVHYFSNYGIPLNDSSINKYSYNRKSNILSLNINGGKLSSPLKIIPSGEFKSYLMRTASGNYVMRNGMGPLTFINGSLSAANNITSFVWLVQPESIEAFGFALILGGGSYFANYFAYKRGSFDYGQAVEMAEYGKLGIMYSYTLGVFFHVLSSENLDNDEDTFIRIAAGVSLIAHPLGTYFGYKAKLIDHDKPGNALVKHAASDFLFVSGMMIPYTIDALETRAYGTADDWTLDYYDEEKDQYYRADRKSKYLVMTSSAIGLSLLPHIFSQELFNGIKVSSGSGLTTMLATYTGASKGLAIASAAELSDDGYVYAALIGSAIDGGITYYMTKDYDFSLSSSLITIGGGTLGGVGAVGISLMVNSRETGVFYSVGSFVSHLGLLYALREPYGTVDHSGDVSFLKNIEINPAAFLPMIIGSEPESYQADFLKVRF